MTKHKIIIIGSGPAGLTAAIYSARANLQPLVIAGTKPGGQLMYTSIVENFPGFPEGVDGPKLMMDMIKQAERFGAVIVSQDAIKVDFTRRPYLVSTKEKTYEAEAVIIATGTSNRKLGVPGEDKLFGKGISICATCDAAFFTNKPVVVVGGGDAAMEEALILSKFASQVTVMVRSHTLKASEIMAKRAQANPKIEFWWNVEVKEIYGENRVTGVKLFFNQTGESRDFPCAGVFIAIGHKPNTEIFEGQVELTERQFIASPDGVHTSVEGVFAGGDVQDYKYRQAVTAAGFGCIAALEAEKYLEGNRL